MTRPFIKIHNSTTDEVIEREMNDEEFAVYEKDLELSAQKAEAKAKAEAEKEAARAKLVALGLTEEDLIAMGLMQKPIERAQ